MRRKAEQPQKGNWEWREQCHSGEKEGLPCPPTSVWHFRPPLTILSSMRPGSTQAAVWGPVSRLEDPPHLLWSPSKAP